MKIDLHNHTIHSDGVLTPKELVERAVKNHVDIFALTDHDSVFGCDEIVEIAKDYPVRVIKGLELSTDHKGDSVHIVCLFKNNIVTPNMIEFSKNIVKKREERAIKMMNNIHDIYGLKIDIDDLFKDAQVITRANMLRSIARINNLSLEEASFYVSNDSKAYIPSTKMSVKEGIALARENNCFVILAHPCLIRYQENLREILDYGFDGIETRYPSVKNDEEYFKKIAKEYKLIPSAGSDCHGDITHSDIGTSTLNEKEFKAIAERIGFKI